ncbi:putative Fe-S protein [Burkholderiales bacterium JOSHI_001]|nr:putative Fe-S protein [Burkholderiales bacterium JOSHI_001]
MTNPAPLETPVPSPCINICRMDDASGWCEGCLRSIDEIVAWSRLDDAAKRQVWAALPARREQWERRQFGEATP